ncbi:MAG: hypothetical protein R3217_09015 [Gammaproteobacteria bacterium]|nr:hypothetical protein [Gammaproteobacteria bacterium]
MDEARKNRLADSPAVDATATLASIDEDIRYYEEELVSLRNGHGRSRELARAQVVSLLLRQRRQLRAEIEAADQDGRAARAPGSNT